MVGNLSAEEIDRLLAEQVFGRLGCSDSERIYVVPISYAFSEGRLLGQTTPGLKVDMMRKNPEVCVQVDEVRSNSDWKSVIVWGRFEELSGADALAAARTLIDRLQPTLEAEGESGRRGREVTPPRANHSAKPQIFYAITVKEKTGRFERPEE